MATTAQPSNSPAPKPEKRDFRQELTDRIVNMLEDGVAPWQKPWEPGRASVGMPTEPHHGQNVPRRQRHSFDGDRPPERL